MRLTQFVMAAAAQHLQHMKEIFIAALTAVQTDTLLLRAKVRVDSGHLHVREHSFPLKKPCYVVGAGKAVYAMAYELYSAIGEHIQAGVLSASSCTFPPGNTKWQSPDADRLAAFHKKFACYEGAHNNFSDAAAMRTSEIIYKLCRSLGEDDLLIVLITGGGSALLPLYVPGVTLEQARQLMQALFAAGANIREVNSVRKSISRLQGGEMARVAYPARVVSLIVSDVIGDPLDVIASGPTVINNDKRNCAHRVLRKYNLLATLPPEVRQAMDKHARSGHPVDDPKTFFGVKNIIIGNNTLMSEEARVKAAGLQYNAVVMSSEVAGNVTEVAHSYAELIRRLKKMDDPKELVFDPRTHGQQLRLTTEKLQQLRTTRREQPNVPLCLIFSGEPTVILRNRAGMGGRNLQLALEMSLLLRKYDDVFFLSCGSDGKDGPTDAAGAMAVPQLPESAMAMAETLLESNDSYRFFETYAKGEFLIRTGPTGTNVMDLHVIIINKTTG